MRKLIQKLRAARAFVALVKDPTKTGKIFEISDVARSRHRERAERVMKPVLEDSAFRELYREKYNPGIEIEGLRALPEGSFGRSVARFLDGNGFEPNGFPAIAASAPLEYLIARLRGTHDLWHVLTGYDTSVAGELALQAFTLAQVRSGLSAMIIAGGLLHLALFRADEVPAAFELIVQAYLRGKRSESLVTMKLESCWQRGLDEVRRELGLAMASA